MIIKEKNYQTEKYLANLFGSFLEACDSALHSKRSRQQVISLKFWLKLILALSYHADGQDNILRIRDVLDYFCDIFSSYHEDEQARVLNLMWYHF